MRLRIAVVLIIGVAVCAFYGTGHLAAAPSNFMSTTHYKQATPLPRDSSVLSSSPTSPTRPHVQMAAAIKGNALSIPSIGLHAPVLNVGLTRDRAIDVPAGMQVGYYVGSVQPGMAGAVFMDGHVDGIFARLHLVGLGHTLSVAYEGRMYHYRVVHTETVALDAIDMVRALSVHGGGTEGLTIMTCAGEYMPDQGTYDRRFVVYAHRI